MRPLGARLFAPCGLTVLVAACVPAVSLPPHVASQLRSPEPTATPSPVAPSPTPVPTPAPALTGHVTAPRGTLTDALGLASTAGQPRLPIANSGLIANLGAGFRLLDTAEGDEPIPGVLVVLADLNQRPYTDPATGALLAATTDAEGAFRLPAVAGLGHDAVLVAYPSGAQRLSAWAPAGAGDVQVDLASTLATEWLRQEAALAGKSLSNYPAADFAALVVATRGAIADKSLSAVVTATDDAGHTHAATLYDLRLDQAQALRNQYAIGLSAVAASNTPIKRVSDAWLKLVGRRPLAVTTLLGNGREPAVGPLGVAGDQPAGAAGDPQHVPIGVPAAIATTPRGDVFVASGTSAPDGGSVRWLQPDGRVTSIRLPLSLRTPAALVVEPSATGDAAALLVADAGANLVLRLALRESGAGPSELDVVAGEDEPLGSAADEPAHPAYVDGHLPFDARSPLTSRWRLGDEGQRTYSSNHNPVPTPARYARLSHPGALARDELGNLYIADHDNQRVRMIPATDGPAFGYRQPVDTAGTGVPVDYAQAATPLRAGCLYTIAGAPNWDSARTPGRTDGHWFGDFGGDGGPAQRAQLAGPSGLAFYGGYLYVGDRENQRVRRISRQTGVIETLAGLPPGPQVATRAQHDGKPTDFQFPTGTLGDGGPAARAQLAYPSGLAVDARDPAHPRLLLADEGSGRVRVLELAADPVTLTTLAGRPHDALGASDRVDHDHDGDARAYADLFGLRALALDRDGNVLLTDARHLRVRKLWQPWN